MTETTTPDPAREWAEAWLEDNPDARLADLHEAIAVVYGDEVADRVSLDVWYADDPESHPNRPLTTADVPAGQGPASLHITSTGGRPALWFKAADGTLHFIRWAAGPGDTPPARALWDHLAATITHVTTKET